MNSLPFNRSCTVPLFRTGKTIFELGDAESGGIGTLLLQGRRAELLEAQTGGRLVLRRSFHLGKLLEVTEYWRYPDSDRVFAFYEGSWNVNTEFVLENGDSYQVRMENGTRRGFNAVWFRSQTGDVLMELTATTPRSWFNRLDRIPLAGTIRTRITDTRLILALLMFMQDAIQHFYDE